MSSFGTAGAPPSRTDIRRPAAPMKDHFSRAARLGIAGGTRYLGAKILRNIPSETVLATRSVSRLLWVSSRPDRRTREFENGTSNPPAVTAEPLHRQMIQEFMDASARMLRRYQPRAFDGRLTLFVARDSPSPERLWDGLAHGGMNIHVIPGVHLDMMEEPMVRERRPW